MAHLSNMADTQAAREMPSEGKTVYSDDESAMVRKASKDSSDKSTGKEKVVKLEPIFFKINDGLDENAINEYRLKYREFRTGKAFGARGEIEKQTVVVSDPLETVIPPFVAKLASMLNNEMYADYVSWSEDGKKVVVKKVAEFSSAILPKYFKHKNFTSFLRQLNMYGFHTARQGRNWREFRNELFTKEIPRLYCKIKRKANVGKTEEKNSVGSNDSSTGNKSKKRKKSADATEDSGSKSQMEILTSQVKQSHERINFLERQLERVQMILAQVRKDLYKAAPLPAVNREELQHRNGKGRIKRMRTDASISSSFSELDTIPGIYADPGQRIPSGRSGGVYSQGGTNPGGVSNDYYYQNNGQDSSMFEIDDEGFFNYSH